MPGVWQSASLIKLLLEFGLVLLVPACFGFVKHFHLVRSGFFAGAVGATLLVVLGVSSLESLMSSPSRAAHKTVSAAQHRTEPPSYFGITPEWTCVEPIVPKRELAGKGGRLEPGRPYLSFGTASGYVILWNASTEGPFKIPADQVRLIPADTPTDHCDA